MFASKSETRATHCSLAVAAVRIATAVPLLANGARHRAGAQTEADRDSTHGTLTPHCRPQFVTALSRETNADIRTDASRFHLLLRDG
jgi:hypothetical protein